MPLDWDIKLDGVSIRSQIASFEVRETRGAYARELTLFAADPSFYDQFVYSNVPQLRIEVLTKIAASWISQGNFYIERPVIAANPDGIVSPGVWGRSSTAIAGQPFAAKVSKNWTENTTCQSIINEMADLCGLTVSFEIPDYSIFANSYACDGVYPIDVIAELASFAGAHVGCTAAGLLTVKAEVFHPAAADYTIYDTDIIDITEQIEYPEFGNRIRISALGAGAGYQINLEALADDDCLPADGVARGTLLAFVTGPDGEAVPDNTIVAWTAGAGVTLDEAYTGTGNYLLGKQKHRASNYYTVTVDFPIADVIGVWAYADGNNKNNYWDAYGSFSGNTITVHKPFAFCDQMLRIAYITSGCAVNRVTAGYTAKDVDVTAEIEGASDTIKVKLGNTCDCGSSLNIKTNPYGAICIGNLAHVLIWATINNKPASGKNVQIRITAGCGELSSENKRLAAAQILNETGFVSNPVSGVSQVSTEIDIAATANPKVYLATDTGKTNDLYASHDGKTIDLDTILATGVEVVIDYYADGATLIAWRTIGVTKACDSEVTAKMADGTEAGLRVTANLSAKDCTVPDTIPDHYGDHSEWDPEYDNWGGDSDGGGFEDSGNDAGSEADDEAGGGGTGLTACEAAQLNSILNDGESGTRFGTMSSSDCPAGGEDWPCSCSEMCDAEVQATGGTYDHSQTIHETAVAAGHTKGTAAYNEAFETIKQDYLSTCGQNCENERNALCGGCEYVSGPASMSPGETAEFVCSDGATALYTMPEGACGTQTITVGCCTFEVRSTNGKWETYLSEYSTGGTCPGVKGGCYYSDFSEPGEGGTRCSGVIVCFMPPYEYLDCVLGSDVGVSGCTANCESWGERQGVPIGFYIGCQRWVCE